jgi:hypothetical protein
MSEELEFRPLSARGGPRGDSLATRSRFDLHSLEAVGTVAVCDVDETPTANVLPSISMSIVQHVKLSDGSLVRLDMDRGVTSARHGAPAGEAVTWKRPLGAVLEEVLALVRADDPADPTAHPWEALAEAARMRGVDVDAEALSALPYQVVLSAEAVETFVG